MNVTTRHLRTVIERAFRSTFFSQAEARDMADVLLYAEMSGKQTQGILKLLGNEPMQSMRPLGKPRVEKQTAISAFINARRNPGTLVGRMATRIAVQKCKTSGFGIVGVAHSYSSTGSLAFYADEIARQNFIGIIMAGTPKAVAPYGSIDKIIGINPMAISFPTITDPLILDMATAAITWYGLVLAKINKTKININTALDRDGNQTTDPQKAMEGAILTFGNNRKMSGLAVMLEMFTGPFLGVTKPGTDGIWYNGSVFIAIDPDLMVGTSKLKKNISGIIRKIHASRPGKKFRTVMLPGEESNKKLRLAKSRKSVDIDRAVYNGITKSS